MKILDRYILTTYLKTFISVFLILILIFVLQTIWLYIRELAGKDLDIMVVFKFLIYFMPKLMPLVLPLTILLASIMVFGDFAENYEFAAMKSTGISLMRAMSGLSVFIVILGITTFFFSNNVIPWSEYNSFNLRKNIAKLKPAMYLAKGQFNEIGTYNIKFSDKSGDRGQYLKDVVIHIKGSDGRTNATTIKSKAGELVSAETSNVLKLVLFDGNYYHDLKPKNIRAKNNAPFAKSTFDKYTINIDLSFLNAQNELDDDKSITNKYNMLKISDLNYTIDSLSQKNQEEYTLFSENIYERAIAAPLKNQTLKKTDSLYTGNILDVFETKNKAQLVNIALNSTRSTNQIITTRKNAFKISKSNFNKHVIALHEKLALGFACIILFFVGAPLGALIRKGGLGLPMIIAILLFLTYHFIGIFATNSAKSGDLNPVIATWFSTLIMLPLGIILTKRATEDKGLFGFDNLIEPLKKLFSIKENEAIDYKFLESFTNEKLFDTIKNYNLHGYTESSRYEAMQVLNSRGIEIDEIRANGIEIKTEYGVSKKVYNDFIEHFKFASTLYIIGAILLILFFVFKNNKMPSLASASIQISIISFVLYMVYYIKSSLNISSFYRNINKLKIKPNFGLLLIGLPIYFISHFLLKKKMNDDLKQNCLDSLK
ncbi:MAG: YjgP/YjgQ family permease [Flavobacteriales bacterium]|nr:YjgP/YjgQ family permease [Flavobacteriia bacterium]NCP04758.1 YjgP/YjgQ family permease [Flavobacteriales bacterium]PIV92646.1 MAG: YjgP/YjgQ family permease [Flavobacteriaceae bacterium CG17_big_fil_post_rev_8_21_14_2_50_33_15]PIY11108.1 MAG: YjgP/YjgQ family permease [Flavobacteriaceae bacterium CG_4_10_14_3_um_filter_33_47]PJB17793.1 MAG: YjgP/YjgQ family permease [Flavobacteriaceae bacterium CG_4_9_14_3_um_filter_33_16]